MKIAIIGATGRFGSAVAHEATAQSPPPVHLLESGSFVRARFTVGY